MLGKARKKIEEIDGLIVKLLDDRAELVKAIGALKMRQGLPFHVPEREKAVMDMVRRKSKGNFPPSALQAVYREILSGSLSLEKPLSVAYFGPQATFTHLAALSRFGRCANYLPQKGIEDVFLEVAKGNADYGVVPIENSTEGVVNHTLDMFVDTSLVVVAEIMMEIHHHLLSRCKKISGIRVLYYFAQPLAQCRNYVDQHLKGCQLIEAASTAHAAMLAARRRGGAAIGAEIAASEYGLNILASNIEDFSNNLTRFLVIGRQMSPRSGRDRTSMMFLVKDKVGALFSAIEPFKRHAVNMTSIESRPSRKRAWEYFFFIDVEGYVTDAPVKRAWRDLQKHCLMARILGSYPRAD